MVLKLPWCKRQMFWAFEHGIFQFFCNFLSDKVETAFWESAAKHSKLFKSKFGHRNLFRKSLYIEVKNEYFDCLKIRFFTFLNSFERRSWKRYLGKQGKDNLNQWLFRKCSWIYLVVKSECPQRLEMIFFHFFASFSVTRLKSLLRKQGKAFKLVVIRSILQYSFGATLSQKRMFGAFGNGFFFAICWEMKLKPFFRKAKQSVQNYFNS